MINRIINTVTPTDIFPVAGGSLGAVSSVSILPSQDMVVGTIVLAALGAVVGYIIKMILDYFVDKRKDSKAPKVEYR